MQRNLDEVRKSKISYIKNNTFKHIENAEIRIEKKHDGYDLLFETLITNFIEHDMKNMFDSFSEKFL